MSALVVYRFSSGLVFLGCISAYVLALCNSPEDEMQYEVTFYGDWSQMVFPKQYPIYRKNAQWSSVIGATHNDRYSMWEEGQVVTREFKSFIEENSDALIDYEMSQSPDVLETFGAPQLMTGVGSTITTIRVNREFSEMSMAVRLVPSPDWFVGVSGFDLCEGSDWLREPLTIDLQPFDAGLDQGFMFSSPLYPQVPPNPVKQITSQDPSHPANSFFYPHLKKLPRIAHITIRPVNPRIKALNAPAWLSSINSKIEGGPASLVVAVTPLDCEVTTWGAWGQCDKKCKVGLQRRFRIVSQKPKNGGQDCPPLVEIRICNERMSRKRPSKQKCAQKTIKKEIKKYMKKQRMNFETSGRRRFIV